MTKEVETSQITDNKYQPITLEGKQCLKKKEKI